MSFWYFSYTVCPRRRPILCARLISYTEHTSCMATADTCNMMSIALNTMYSYSFLRHFLTSCFYSYHFVGNFFVWKSFQFLFPFIMVISMTRDTYHFLPSDRGSNPDIQHKRWTFYHWATALLTINSQWITCFYDLRLLLLGFEHPTFSMRGERSNRLHNRRNSCN